MVGRGSRMASPPQFNAPTEQTSAFLAAFFAPPNDIAFVDIKVGGKAAHLVPWVERLLLEPSLPTVLPCRSQGRIQWYGVALSEAQLGVLGEQLLAFIGPTYSTFR